MAAQDPYFQVRDNLNSMVAKIKAKYERFQDMVKTSDTSSDKDFIDLRKGLTKDYRQADNLAKELKNAVDAIDKNKEKFPHITAAELGQRKKFVDDTQRTLTTIMSGMDSPAVKRKLEDDRNKAKRLQAGGGGSTDAGSSGSGINNALHQENSRFIADQKQVTLQQIDQQDVALLELGQGVDRLHDMGKAIGSELKEQNLMLNHLEDDIDEAGNKMNFVTAKLSKLLKTKDSCQIWTIVALVIILIILVLLVIYT